MCAYPDVCVGDDGSRVSEFDRVSGLMLQVSGYMVFGMMSGVRAWDFGMFGVRAWV